MPEAVKATMQWRGRFLLCNGVRIAEMARGFNCCTVQYYDGDIVRATDDAARRAINRRFSLPDNFGEKA